MALIICPECGKQVSDKASACPHCGWPISISGGEGSVSNAVSQATSISLRKKKQSFIIPIIAILAIVAIGSGLYVFMLSPEAKLKKAYGEALEIYNSGNYSEALSKFETLGAYGNSSDIVVSCKYELGLDAMESTDWETAVSYFSNIEYNDSAELILHCRYNQGIAAMENFDWESAASFFTDLNYEYSERMLTDCSFMMALEKSVLRRMETTAKESSDYRSLVTTELAYLEDFRNASFYSATIGTQAKKYIKGLDTQLSGLSYDYYYEYQRDWNTGLVTRYEALEKLYTDFDFMADNKDFIGEYINQLAYHQKWLTAFNALENGLTKIKNPIGKNYYVEYYFKNNSEYTATITFDITFWKDEEGKVLLGTSSTVVEDIGPYEEFTVRAYVPEAAQGIQYWFNWTNYYNEIKIN